MLLFREELQLLLEPDPKLDLKSKTERGKP
jgi:hypothetical protein